jgi:hypothetical protein
MSSYITDSDLLFATSSVSIPFYYIYFPKSEKIEAEFVYNYYTRDEGVSEETFLDSIDADTDQYLFVSENYENGVLPRVVNLSFSSNTEYENTSLPEGLTISNAIDQGKLIYEDAPFDNNFSGILIHDTAVDEKIYSFASSSDVSATNASTRDFLSAGRQQSSGLKFSEADTRSEITNLYETDVKAVNLGLSLNNLFVSDILETSARWQASAYADEFAAAYNESVPVQDRAKSTAFDPFRITENEIDVEIETVYSNFFRSGTETSGLRSGKVGYIIEKYGEQLDGSTLRYPDIVIEDPTISSYQDTQVRYGATYKYKIRTIYSSVFSLADTSSFPTPEGFSVAISLFASTGEFATVDCIEIIPPDPPVNISFQQTLSGLYIRWNFPSNPQKDIKRFQVFRRKSINDPFSIIREINFDNTILPYTSGETIPESKIQIESGPKKSYLDTTFVDFSSDYIYALCCIDAHGYSSSFSEQFRVRFDRITGKLLVSRISTAGAPKPYPNVNILGDFFSDLIKDSGHSRIRIYFDPEYLDVTREGESLSLISTTGFDGINYKLSLTEINLIQNQTVDISIGDIRIGSDGIPASLARFYTAN